jgi:RNA polymerase sigma-54 factor
MLKQRLQQKLLQKLSPQQIQMIKLLEIPTMQLEQRIKKELEDNPVLEEGSVEDNMYREEEEENQDNVGGEQDEFTFEDYLNEEDIPSYRLMARNYSKDDRKENIPFSVGITFHDFLESQLGLRSLTEQQQILAQYILGNIDDDGYLRRSIDSIVDDIAFSQNITTKVEELAEILEIIKDLDPPGVGAESLQECLLLQIDKKDHSLPEIVLAEKILKDHFEEFTKKHYGKIISRLDIKEEELKKALEEILKLNPKPGSSYSDPQNKTSDSIVPDFILENNDGELQLSLNSKNVPELKISKEYLEMLKSYHLNRKGASREQKEAMTFVRQKLDSAKWFIDAIRQRQNTLLLTMHAIINFQSDYFQEGEESKLKPMILKDIADVTGLDISTVSRVANSKYIQTTFGIFPLRYFFSEGMQTDSGEEVSTREIKKILEECINNEDKRKPLTDEKLGAILNEKGYPVARRTVAKYREQLNIPVARMRKEL